MLNVFTDRKDFDLGIDDHGLSGDKDINIYVLDEDMRALSLMKAFRACRYDPLRTYYYIPKTESDFSHYATESIKRGTVNVFSDLEELRDALRSEVEAWCAYSIPECITRSTMNFKILANREASTSLSMAVTTALNKCSCYTVVKALLQLFQSGGPLFDQQFKTILAELKATDPQAQKADEAFKTYGSQFLSVLAADDHPVDTAWHTEEYDGMTMHVMFQPLEPKKDIQSRVRIVAQLVTEKKGS